MLYNVFVVSLVHKKTGKTKTYLTTSPYRHAAISDAVKQAKIKDGELRHYHVNLATLTQFRIT